MSPDLLRLVYADDDIAVVDKPSGLLSCPGRGEDKADSVQHRVPLVLPRAHGPILAHRLDQPTSGLMVVALHPAAHRHLRLQFEARRVHKSYEAVLDGEVRGEGGLLQLPFRLDVERRPWQVYDPVHGKWGITHWRVLSRLSKGNFPRTRVCFVPLTGRTHQLRLHAAHPRGLDCPIAGDALYGNAATAPRLWLHAASLRFAHPATERPMTFRLPAPF